MHARHISSADSQNSNQKSKQNTSIPELHFEDLSADLDKREPKTILAESRTLGMCGFNSKMRHPRHPGLAVRALSSHQRPDDIKGFRILSRNRDFMQAVREHHQYAADACTWFPGSSFPM